MNSHRGMGTVYKRPDSSWWWIQYWRNGEKIREASGSQKRSEAVALLMQRNSEVQQGKLTGPSVNKTTVNDLLEIVANDYAINRRRVDLRGPFKWLRDFFGSDIALQATSDRIAQYVRGRLRAGAAHATINRELAVLRRGFVLGARAGRVGGIPFIATLKEDNARKGFFERETFERIVSCLPPEYQALARTAYITGWRTQSELLTRQRRHLDLKNGWLRLDPGETKNGEGRMFPLTAELHTILEAQVKDTRWREQFTGSIIPWLFHRYGHQIKSWRKAWANACRDAGVPGALVHDFRRTAVRNLERAGVSRSAAMKMTGHLTESVYRRYAIVDEAMLKEAATKLSAVQ